MKKILTGLILSVTFLLAASYILIPGKIRISRSVTISAALTGVSRVLTNENTWEKWWPGKTPFTYDEMSFKPGGDAFNVIEVEINSGHETIKSRMELVLIDNDSMTLIWNAEQQAGPNPIKRYLKYKEVKEVEKNMNTLLGHIKTFFEKTENVYGFFIQKTKVVDSVLISSRRSFDHKPDRNEIDDMIQRLKKYITENGVKEKNYPMLNVMKIDNNEFDVMTAIPVDKALPETKEFTVKYLLKGGNILESPIQGGPYTIEKGIEQLETYRADHQYTSPAIPFQLLVTDRKQESDTSKWITKLYYPII